MKRRAFIFGVGAFAAGLFIPKAPTKIFLMGSGPQDPAPIQLPPMSPEAYKFVQACDREMRRITMDMRLNIERMAYPKWIIPNPPGVVSSSELGRLPLLSSRPKFRS